MNKSNDIIFDIALNVLKDQPTLQSWTFTDGELLKFARLIVRECCVVMFADPRLSDVRTATRGCARSIKETFGVDNA